MPRSLSFSLDQRMLHPTRRPAWKVYLYDVRSTDDTISDIVRDLTLETLTGPLDITENVQSVEIQEVAGDFVGSGVASSRATLTIIDNTPGSAVSQWDPQFSADDPTAPARFVRRGNVIRIVEGDADVAEADWPLTFTGILVGQAGVDRGRAADPVGRSLISIAAVDRSAEYVNQVRSSEEFARGAAYLTMGTEVATAVMGLDSDEVLFSGWGSQTTGLLIQFVEQSPLVSIAQVMFVDGFLPRFNGEGKLTQSAGEISQSPARIYTDLRTIRHIARPYSELNPVNSVEVVGLEGQKTKVVQQRQPLADVDVTTGFFTNGEEIRVYWSDDRTQLAENIKMDVQKSVNGGLSSLGGGEDWTLILAENQTTISVGAQIELDTGYAPYIIVFLSAVYVVLAAIPDTVVTAVFGGVTIPVGRIIQAIAMAAVVFMMSKIGRGQYQFIGDPVEWVYKELRAIAELEGLTSEELNRVTIENHLVQEQDDGDAIARVVLFRQQAKGNPRSITALHDLRLEPDDVWENPDGRRFLIETITRVLLRGAEEILASYSTFEVTPGLEP
ncbi:MAG: hypothetical protein GY898_11200 [Proteobacteria bacterium]|nr:hypothetical protein [Pseudomonadota bacterium]